MNDLDIINCHIDRWERTLKKLKRQVKEAENCIALQVAARDSLLADNYSLTITRTENDSP